MSITVEIALKEAMLLDGAIGAALVDAASGLTLGTANAARSSLDLAVAAAGNTEVLRAKHRTMQLLGMDDSIEDILITLDKQYHVIRPLNTPSGKGLFLYLALDVAKANLGLARHHLRGLAERIEV